MKESQFDTQNPRLESNTAVSERDERPDDKACTEIENAASECETAETAMTGMLTADIFCATIHISAHG